MKNKLLSSVIFITIFWWVVFYIYWIYSIKTLDGFFHDLFVLRDFPSVNDFIQSIVISFGYWIIPSILIVFAIGLVVFGATVLGTIIPNIKQEKIINSKDSWRGIKISMGEVPRPTWGPEIPEYRSEKVDAYIDEKVASCREENPEYDFTNPHKKIFTDILFFISQNKKTAFVGDGHGVDLWEHTINVVNNVWKGSPDPLLIIAAASHDAGKILAWKKHPFNEEWKRVGYHDDYGMLILSSLKSFEELKDIDKTILKIVVGYSHKENKIPILDEKTNDRVEDIFKILNKADRDATADEKSKVLEREETPEMITKAFVDAVKNAPFNTEKSRAGQSSICFRKEGVLYLLEPGFRDLFLDNLSPDVAAAYGNGYRRQGNMSKPTVALINHLKKIGWLVENASGMYSECGLWSVQAGKNFLY